MTKPLTAVLALVLLAGAAFCIAQEASSPPKMPDMPKPQKEHQWLQRFVGEWEGEGEITMEPGQPPIECKGTEVVKPLGGFWIVSHHTSEMMGHPMNAVLTLGYSAKEKKYIGTWVDSMQDYLWTYKGSVDDSGNVLTLDTEGPCPMRPGEIVKFKEVVEFKSDDERVFTSSMYLDGKWITPIKIVSRRTK
jgi:Protein of unknown function (DUF1579)